MYKECPDCKKRLMIITEGYPAYTHGSYIVYGCPDCGKMVFEYDDSNVEGNPMKCWYDSLDINKYHVSN